MCRTYLLTPLPRFSYRIWILFTLLEALFFNIQVLVLEYRPIVFQWTDLQVQTEQQYSEFFSQKTAQSRMSV